MEKETAFTLALAVFVVVAGIQGIELLSISNTLAHMDRGTGNIVAQQTQQQAQPQVQIPPSLQNLPSMVGGC